MKNTIKVFGVIAFAVVIGFSMAACSNSSNGDGGGGRGGGLEGDGVVWELNSSSGNGFVFKSGIVYLAYHQSNSTWTAVNNGTYTSTTIHISTGTFPYTISGNTLTLSGSVSCTKKTGQTITGL